jgi:threonine/homoserine/homoserine lactone efflux protein
MSGPWVQVAVGIAGGIVLLWMGLGMLRTRPQAFDERRDVAGGCVLAGVTTTLANPYWLVWWATVGATLVASAGAWGLVGIAAFAVTHWLCDVGWLSFLSWGVFTSRRFQTPAVYRAVLVVCGAVLLGFGAYFLARGAGSLFL